MKFSVTKLVLLFVVSFGLSGCFKTAQERAAEHLENGLRLVEQGDLPRAIVEFRNTLKYDEDSMPAYRQMARANRELDHIPEAYAGFLRLVEHLPDDIEGRIALSEMAFEKESWEEFDRHSARLQQIASDLPEAAPALLGAAYRRAVLDADTPRRDALVLQAEDLAADLPGHPIMQRIRIDAYVSQGRYEAAVAVLDDAIATRPDDIDLHTARLGLLGHLNDRAAVATALRAMLDRFPDDRRAQETYLAYLLSADRLQDAETFLEDIVARATPDTQNSAFLSLINFLRETKGDAAALARINVGVEDEEGQSWQIMRATLLFEMGQRDQGIAQMRAVLTADPTTLTRTEILNAQTALARMLLINGDAVAARQMVAEILSEDPGLPNTLKMRAAWLIAEDDTTAAINDLRVALENNPNDSDAMVLMAEAYARAGNRSLQQDFLAQAAAQSRNAPRYALLLAHALIADDKLLQAESALIAALRMAPENVDILQVLGQVYLKLDDLARTEQVADRLAKLQTAQAIAIAQALQAELIARRSGVDEALAFLEQQATQSGDPISGTLTMIQARLRAGRTEDALRTAKQAVADNPDDPRLRNALALSYGSARDFNAAKAEFTALLDDHPEEMTLYLQLARINAALGDFAAGAATIDGGLAIWPDAPELLWAKASYLERDGDITGAINIYETLYARNSDNDMFANNLASLLVTSRDDPESLARAQTIARRLNGTDVPAFQDTYGFIQFRRGDLQEALSYLEPAAAGLPGDPVVLDHLAQTYAALHRPDDALAQKRKALALVGPLGDATLRDRLTADIAQLQDALAHD